MPPAAPFTAMLVESPQQVQLVGAPLPRQITVVPMQEVNGAPVADMPSTTDAHPTTLAQVLCRALVELL